LPAQEACRIYENQDAGTVALVELAEPPLTCACTPKLVVSLRLIKVAW
jgi:hypothetical protein